MNRWIVLGLALALVGCGGGDGGTDAGGGDVDSGGGDVDSGGGGMPVDVVFLVREGGDETPIVGAMMALDRPDGTRDEFTSDASGHITVSIDWAAGPHHFTTAAPGHVVVSAINTDGTALDSIPMVDGAFPIDLFSNVPNEDLVSITGAVTGVMSIGNNFGVYPAITGAENYNARGPDYTIRVPRGEPFRAAVEEYSIIRNGTNDFTQPHHAHIFIDFDAQAADGTRDIDISTSDAFTEISGTVASPGTGTPLADANFYILVTDFDSNLFFGSPSAVTPNGADLDYTIPFVTPGDAVRPMTRYSLQDDPNFSLVFIEGYPTAGAQTWEFMTPPDIVTPAFGVSHDVHDPIVLGRLVPGVVPSIRIHDANDEDRTRWVINDFSRGDTITVPELPSGMNADAVFPTTGDFYARPYVCEESATDVTLCERFAGGRRQFDLVVR